MAEMTTFTHFWPKSDPNFDPKFSYINFLPKKSDQKDKNHIAFCYVSLKLKKRSENFEYYLFTTFGPNRAQILAPNPPLMDFCNKNFNSNFISMEEIILIANLSHQNLRTEVEILEIAIFPIFRHKMGPNLTWFPL